MAAAVAEGGARRRGAKAPAGGERPKTNPYAEWVTPAELRKLVTTHYGTKTLMFDRELAETLLEFNTANRKVNQRKLDAYARQMRSGDFENTGEPIIVSKEEVLNSGQHRLLALVDAGVTLDMDVRFGIPRRLFTKTDTGSSRNPADVMSIRGVSHGSTVAATLRLLVLFERGLPGSIRDFVSNDEVNRAFERWPDVEAVVERVAGHGVPRPIRSTPLFATAYLASHSPGRSKLDSWLESVASGVNVKRDNSAYQLRERLIRGIDAPIGTREGQLERFALMIKSWNLYRKGEAVTSRDFRWRSGGSHPEPFPTVQGLKLPEAAQAA